MAAPPRQGVAGGYRCAGRLGSIPTVMSSSHVMLPRVRGDGSTSTSGRSRWVQVCRPSGRGCPLSSPPARQSQGVEDKVVRERGPPGALVVDRAVGHTAVVPAIKRSKQRRQQYHVL